MSSIKEQFERDGFYHAKSVYSPDEVATLELAFDRIVAQLMAADENINARWSGPEMDKMGAQNTVIYHTHQVHEFSLVKFQFHRPRTELDVFRLVRNSSFRCTTHRMEKRNKTRVSSV